MGEVQLSEQFVRKAARVSERASKWSRVSDTAQVTCVRA